MKTLHHPDRGERSREFAPAELEACIRVSSSRGQILENEVQRGVEVSKTHPKWPMASLFNLWSHRKPPTGMKQVNPWYWFPNAFGRWLTGILSCLRSVCSRFAVAGGLTVPYSYFGWQTHKLKPIPSFPIPRKVQIKDGTIGADWIRERSNIT